MNLPHHTNKVESVVDIISRASKENDSTIVSVWGASGSGKSFLASSIHSQLNNSRVLSVDSYLSQEQISGEYCNDDRFARCIEGINPNIWDQNRLNEDLISVRENKEISVPQFDHKNRMQTDQRTILASAAITIVEGAYAYENVIKDDIDMLILVDASLHDRFTRKLIRLLYRTGRTDIDESITRYLKKTQPSLERYWNTYLPDSHVIYKNSYSPGENISDLDLPPVAADIKTPIQLSPKQGYGLPHESEHLGFSTAGGDTKLHYSIGGRAVISHTINAQSIDAILEYYDEE